MWWLVNATQQLLYSLKKEPVTIVQEVVWPTRMYGRVRKTSPHIGIRSPDQVGRNESLYRLRYAGPRF